jgi:hypothetical protein
VRRRTGKKTGNKLRVSLQRAKQGSKNHHFALLSVSRQIYHETNALTLLPGTFKFSSLTAFDEGIVLEHSKWGRG